MREFELADEQKDALIKELWTILGTFVDRSFGEDPVQQALEKNEENSGYGDSDTLELDDKREKTETLDDNEPEP